MERRVKMGLAILGLCVLTVIVAELAARAVFWTADAVGIGMTEERADRPAFDDREIDRQAVFREMVAAQEPAYEPYTLWRHRPFHGVFINVDDEGHRVTTHSSEDPAALRIWVLGGSTVFGYGVPDDDTIPSHLARLLGEAGLPASVLNLGEDGYVSMQETIRLAYEIHRRRLPDLVIDYGGFNDSMSAWAYPDQPAIHKEPAKLRERFETPLLAAIRESNLYRLVEYAKNRYFPGPPAISMPLDRGRRAGRWTGEIWAVNMRSIEALGDEFGFDTLIAFQPMVDLGHKPLDPSEKPSRFRTPIQQAMHERVLELAASADGPDVLDLTDVFDDVADPMYVDPVHLSGRGNEIVATALARVVLDTYGRDDSR